MVCRNTLIDDEGLRMSTNQMHAVRRRIDPAATGKKTRLTFFMVVALFILPACVLAAPAGAAANEHPHDRRVLKAVIPEDVPPTYYRDPKTHEAAGFAVDVMNEIAARAGFSVTYSFQKDWPSIIAAVRNRRADIAPVLGMSEERMKLLAFTSAIETVPVSLFVRSDNTTIKGLRTGITVGVLEGSAAYEAIKRDYPAGIELKRYKRFSNGLFDLLAGQLDVFCCPAPTLERLARDARVEDRIKTIGAPVMELKRGIALRQDDRELYAKLNAATEAFVGTPEYQRIYTKWFGRPRPFFALSKQNVVTAIILAVVIVLMASWRHLSLLGMNRRLRQSEADIKEAQHIARMGRWELDLLKDRLRWSDTIYTLFEIDKTKFGATYEAFLEAVHPDDREMVNAAYTESLKNKRPYEVIHRLLMKDGRIKWVSEACRTDYNPQGQAVRSVGIVQDITERKQAQEALQESEKRHHQLFENMQEGFMIQDIIRDDAGEPVDVRYLELNPAMERFLGKTRAEIIGKTRTQVLGTADPAVIEANSSVAATGRPFHLERYSSGAKRWYESFSYAFGQGQIATLVLDITERKQAEEKVRQSEAKFRNLFESSTDGIFIIDLDGKFIDVNATAYTRLGYSKEEMLSLHISKLDDPVFSSRAAERMKQISEHGVAVFEAAHLRKDGTSMPVEVNSRLMDYEGRTVFFSVIRDITERKRAEKALRESERRYRILFDRSPDGVLLIDPDGKILEFNEAAHSQLGYTREEFTHLRVSDIDPVESADEIRGRLAKIREEEQARFDVKHRTKQGEIREVSVIAQVMMLSGRPVVYAIWHDITERKQMEMELRTHREKLMRLVEERTVELKETNRKLLAEISQREQMEAELVKAQKLESLGVLAGGIAHDFNNLLTTIMGNVSLALIDLDEGHPSYRQLVTADRALLRAQELTQQLLTFSRGGAPVKRAASIGELLREAVGFALRGSRVRCEFTIPDDLWKVDVDAGQISQVIHNLAINADQAMPEGGIIGVRCENADLADGIVPGLSRGRYVKVLFEDNGVGIPRGHLTKIFDPYFTTKQRGSGLGLATTYSIMQKHGGRISVESVIGVGTTFILFLPAARGAFAAQAQELDTPLAPGSGTILIMDDDESIRQTAADALIRYNYTSVFAENGSQAIELYRQAMDAGKPFAAVIMDLTIPGGMGGREALQRLREIDPAVKAIVSSGYSNDPIMADYRDYGFAGVVAKPYRIKQLIETVSRVIAGA
jgi:PAS domain S-box-containing protein